MNFKPYSSHLSIISSTPNPRNSKIERKVVQPNTPSKKPLGPKEKKGEMGKEKKQSNIPKMIKDRREK